jgi:hypothetical protein
MFKERKVTRNGIIFKDMWYYDVSLLPFVGEIVLVKTEGEYLEVYNQDNTLICTAKKTTWET